jgi:aminomethyltransferase
MLEATYPHVVGGPPKPSAIFEPLVFSMPPGTGRYVVEGLGAILLHIEAGDEVQLINT